MSLLWLQIGLFLLSFLAIWVGAGLVISELVFFARSLKISSFSLSFFVLGLLTSIPEFSIGISSIVANEPEIFVGNLIGASVVILLLVIPLMALVSKGVRQPVQLKNGHLAQIVIVIIAPLLLSSDGKVNGWDSVLLGAMYLALWLSLARDQSLMEKVISLNVRKQKKLFWPMLKIIIGFVVLVFASHQIIDSTNFFATYFGWSRFLVSLLLTAIGSNIPELSLVFRSIFDKQKGVALADHLGSAAANTMLFSIFAISYQAPIFIANHTLQRSLSAGIGITFFYVFFKSKNQLSRVEAAILLCIYAFFVILQIPSLG